jgi:transposase
MMQAPMPSLPIPCGQACPALLAHIAVAEYCDHVPLNRPGEICAATVSTSTHHAG